MASGASHSIPQTSEAMAHPFTGPLGPTTIVRLNLSYSVCPRGSTRLHSHGTGYSTSGTISSSPTTKGTSSPDRAPNTTASTNGARASPGSTNARIALPNARPAPTARCGGSASRIRTRAARMPGDPPRYCMRRGTRRHHT